MMFGESLDQMQIREESDVFSTSPKREIFSIAGIEGYAGRFSGRVDHEWSVGGTDLDGIRGV